MNTARLLTLLLSILVFSSAISTANATIVKEYEYDSYIDGTREFAFKVKIVIETEANNQWLVGSKYFVHFIVTPTYVNPNIFSEVINFTIRFHSPEIYLWPDGVEKVDENETGLRLAWTGSLVIECSPHVEKRQRLWPCMYYAIYYKNELILNKSWDSWEPIYINVKSPSLLPTEVIFIAIGMVSGATLTGVFFIYKMRSKR